MRISLQTLNVVFSLAHVYKPVNCRYVYGQQPHEWSVIYPYVLCRCVFVGSDCEACGPAAGEAKRVHAPRATGQRIEENEALTIPTATARRGGMKEIFVYHGRIVRWPRRAIAIAAKPGGRWGLRHPSTCSAKHVLERAGGFRRFVRKSSRSTGCPVTRKHFMPVAQVVGALGLLMLSGCNVAEFNPKGAIGEQEKTLIITALGVMLLVVIPVIVLTLVSPGVTGRPTPGRPMLPTGHIRPPSRLSSGSFRASSCLFWRCSSGRPHMNSIPTGHWIQNPNP